MGVGRQQLALSLDAPASGEVTLRIDAAAWRALNDNGRDDLSRPRGDVVVRWCERDGAMVARVGLVAAETLRGMCEALGVDVHEEAA